MSAALPMGSSSGQMSVHPNHVWRMRRALGDFPVMGADGFRDFWSWDTLTSALSLGLGTAAIGQAVRGNASDEVVFAVYAAGLIPVGLGLLWRAAHRREPRGLAFVTAYATAAGLDAGFGPPIWATLLIFMALCGLTTGFCARVRRT